MEYSKKDVEILANTVLNHWEDHNAQSRYRCNYCSGEYSRLNPEKDGDNYPHKPDCPVLVARDTLTP